MEARAIVREARAQYFPTLGGWAVIQPITNLIESGHDPRRCNWYRHSCPATADYCLFVAT